MLIILVSCYEVFPSDIFQSFIENKILKHKMIYEIAGKNEQLTNIFKEGIVHIDDALGTKLLLYKRINLY